MFDLMRFGGVALCCTDIRVLFVQSLALGYLSCFQFAMIIHEAAVNIRAQVLLRNHVNDLSQTTERPLIKSNMYSLCDFRFW